MKRSNRNIWLVIAIIVVPLCCCLLAVVGAAAFFWSRGSVVIGTSRVTEHTEQVFSVGQTPSLQVQNFAGNIVVSSGQSGQINVTVTKRASNSNNLDRINVNVSQQGDLVVIRSPRPSSLSGNMSVAIDVTVPANTQLDLNTAAGNVQVQDVTGEISAHTSAGNVQVQGASAAVALDTQVGNVDYTGTPTGACTFRTDAGNVTLRLPADTNAQVDLSTGLGNISLGGFNVEGNVSSRDVTGSIGSGQGATITAHTSLGNVNLVRR